MSATDGRAPGPAPGGMDRYLWEIGRHPLLSREEEAEMSRRWREEGDREALDALVTANLRFVVTVAKRYRHRGVPFEDLVNEGNLGLLRAAERFDGRRGVRFVTYAVWWIRQAILGALASAAPPARPGRTGPGGARARSVREPDAGGWREHRGGRVVSLDGGARRGDGTPLGERLADADAEDPGRTLEMRSLREALEAGMAFLPEREERVLRRYYGLDGGAPRSLERIGRELGVSRERIRQLKRRALARLREGPHRAALRELAG